MTAATGMTLQVDELVIDVELSASEAKRLTPVLRAAFEDLARRLSTSPTGRWREPAREVLGRLRVEELSADELLGPRGAVRLAESFYTQLLEAGVTR